MSGLFHHAAHGTRRHIGGTLCRVLTQISGTTGTQPFRGVPGADGVTVSSNWIQGKRGMCRSLNQTELNSTRAIESADIYK